MNKNLSSLFRLTVATTATLVMWCGIAGLLYVIDSPTVWLNGGSSHTSDWSSIIYAASGMTLLAVLSWFAIYALRLRRPIFGFAVFVGTFFLVEAATWYLGERGSGIFGIAPKIAHLFEDDGALVLLMVTNPLVSALSGVLYAALLLLIRRIGIRQNSYGASRQIGAGSC